MIKIDFEMTDGTYTYRDAIHLSAGSIDNGGNTGWNFASVGPVSVLSNMIAFF